MFVVDTVVVGKAEEHH